MRPAQHLLDAVQSLAQIDAFDGGAYIDQLSEELGGSENVSWAGLEETDTRLRSALGAIDAFSNRCMRVRLDHLLAEDASVAPPLRKVLAATVTSYAGDLRLMRERVTMVAGRVDPRGAEATADAIVATAQRVLDNRVALHERVLEIARRLATERIPAARKAARDRYAEEPARRKWTAVLRDLEATVERPARVAEATWAERVATVVGPDEPIEEAPELTLGELIEPYER
jgi:hypothetical protein